jgi:hypothetical protein
LPVVEVAGHRVSVHLVRNSRARRYILRLATDRVARVTVPRGGTAAEAMRFVERQKGWLEDQLRRVAERPMRPLAWGHGTEVLIRGQPTRLELAKDAQRSVARLGEFETRIPADAADVKPYVQCALWRLAIPELTTRTLELARQSGFEANRIRVRNQRSRWGSCSRRGTISLNWRLIQTPEFVRDYVILHELAHLKEMNHSKRFWRLVEELCPDYRKAESYLRQNASLLRE